jgi:hypothetical protein
MTQKEEIKLRELDAKLNTVKATYSEILIIYNQVHRKKLMLELDIKIIEQSKMDLLQGQLDFDKDLGF